MQTIDWGLGVDNGYKLYINGHYVSGDWAHGSTYQWEYTGSFSESLLTNGINVVAVALDDGGGGTAFDMEITGDLAPVPEPATMLLFGTGLAGIVGNRIRRKNK